MMRHMLATLAVCVGLSGWAQPTLFGSATTVWDSSRAPQATMVGQDALYLGASGGTSDEGVLVSYSAKHKTIYNESVGNWRLTFLMRSPAIVQNGRLNLTAGRASTP